MSEPTPPEEQSRRMAFVGLAVVIAMAGGVFFLLAEPDDDLPADRGARAEQSSPRRVVRSVAASGMVQLSVQGGGNLQCGDGSFREIPASGSLTLPAPSSEPLPCTVSQGRQTICSGEIDPKASTCSCNASTGRLTCE